MPCQVVSNFMKGFREYLESPTRFKMSLLPTEAAAAADIRYEVKPLTIISLSSSFFVPETGLVAWILWFDFCLVWMLSSPWWLMCCWNGCRITWLMMVMLGESHFRRQGLIQDFLLGGETIFLKFFLDIFGQQNRRIQL